MRALHNSRHTAYRMPYGAVAPNTPVTLSLDVWDARGATITLRTWRDGVGEERFAMSAVDEELHDGATRYQAIITPDAEGVIWYQFIIKASDGHEMRYGVPDGRRGGEGQLFDWEPPSFQLTVGSADRASGEKLGATIGDAIVAFLRNELSAPGLAESIEAARENWPGSFDEIPIGLDSRGKLHLIARLSGASNQECNAMRLDDVDAEPPIEEGRRGLAKGRLWCATLIQALMPGTERVLWTPAAKAKPLKDADGHSAGAPAPLPWERDEADCETIVTNALDIKAALPLFANGAFECRAANENVIEIWRRGPHDSACLLVNGSLTDAQDVEIPLDGESVSEVISGYGVAVTGEGASRSASVHLYQIGTALLYFHDDERLARPMDSGLGVLAHITSLPASCASSTDAGTLGIVAHEFAEKLAQAGVRYWQVLPVNPTDEYGSPYAGISAFAGNTRLLQAESADEPFDEDDFRAFCIREHTWLDPYAAFMAIRRKVGAGKPWQAWPKKYRTYDPELIAADAKLKSYADACRREQFTFERQWEALRTCANEHGVQIIGDMPIYVSADSADVWANREIFQLGSDGRPDVVAGCPPDSFAEEGQIWGNPVYDWAALEKTGYEWWMQRLERAFELYDYVRLDHFIGFARYFCIPAGEKAEAGTYRPGPGLRFFQIAHERFGQLPVIAEDLGMITPAVRTLTAACGFPGMDIVQFVDGNDPLSGYQPRPDKIAYSGTHDNQTLVGYVTDRYPEIEPDKAAVDLLEKVATCSADVCIMPLQDLAGLDDDARMNIPGTNEGNWIWQADATVIDEALKTAKRLVALRG